MTIRRKIMDKTVGFSRSILIYVEDPGALNGLLPMARRLSGSGHKIYIELDGYAKNAEGLDLRGLHPEVNSIDKVSKKKYDAVLVGTSENQKSMAFKLIEMCRIVSVKTFAFIDSPANPEYRFSGEWGEALEFAPDFLIVVDEETAVAYKDLGFNRHEILVVEHPHFESLHKQRVDFSRQTPADMKAITFGENYRKNTVITFCSELSSGLDIGGYEKNSDYSLEAPTNHVKRTDVVVYNFLEAVDKLRGMGASLKTVLRLHPKQTLEDIKLSERFDLISKGGDAVQVCISSDIVVGMTSMILVEAVELGTVVISLLPRSKEVDWIHTSIRHKIPICTDYTEFLSQLRLAFKIRHGVKNGESVSNVRGYSASYMDFIIGRI